VSVLVNAAFISLLLASADVWCVCVVHRVAYYEKSEICRYIIRAECPSTEQAMDNGSWCV